MSSPKRRRYRVGEGLVLVGSIQRRVRTPQVSPRARSLHRSLEQLEMPLPTYTSSGSILEGGVEAQGDPQVPSGVGDCDGVRNHRRGRVERCERGILPLHPLARASDDAFRDQLHSIPEQAQDYRSSETRYPATEDTDVGQGIIHAYPP